MRMGWNDIHREEVERSEMIYVQHDPKRAAEIYGCAHLAVDS